MKLNRTIAVVISVALASPALSQDAERAGTAIGNLIFAAFNLGYTCGKEGKSLEDCSLLLVRELIKP